MNRTLSTVITTPDAPLVDAPEPLVAPAAPRVRRHRAATLARDLFVNGTAAWPVWPGAVRAALYRIYGMEIETHGVSPGCFFGSPRIRIGAGTTVNYDCFFDALDTIEIGRDCAIGMQVLFCTSTHELGGPARRAGPPRGLPIKIGDGCWIGGRAVILPGVTIGDGCVIAAGAVVTKSCAENGLYAGVPATRIKDLAA